MENIREICVLMYHYVPQQWEMDGSLRGFCGGSAFLTNPLCSQDGLGGKPILANRRIKSLELVGSQTVVTIQ